ncbi:MAG: DUF4836 family protein [Flavobacteriales bacterium]
MKTIQKALCALSVTVLFFSCSKEYDRGNLIPKRAIGVMAINTPKIVDEIKWDVLFGSDLLKFKSFEKNEMMKKVMANPMGTGIGFAEKSYFFVDSAASLENVVAAAIIPLSDGGEFSEFVKANVDAKNQSKKIGELEIKKLDDKLFLAWNEHTLFTIANKGSEKEVADYITALYAAKESSLLTTEFKGKEVFTGDAHIAMYMNYSTILSSMKEQLAKSGMKMDFGAQISYAGVVNFKNGLMDVVVDCYSDGKLMDMTKFITDPNIQSVASTMDASNSLAFFGASFSWKALPEALAKMGTKPMIDGVMMNMGISLDTLCSSLGNDIAFSFDGMQAKQVTQAVEVYGDDYMAPPTIEMQTHTEKSPLMKAAMSLNDTAYIKGLLRKFLGRSILPGTADVFQMPFGGGYLFFKDKLVMFSSDSLSYVAMANGTVKFDNAVLKDKAVAVYANTKDLQKKMALDPSGADGISANEYNTTGIFQKYFSTFAIESAKPTVEHSQITFKINMVNKEENFIISVLKFAKEIETQLMPKAMPEATPGA